MQETGTRINIPPPSVMKNEIVITGEKEQVAQAVTRIKMIYEDKVRRIINWWLYHEMHLPGRTPRFFVFVFFTACSKLNIGTCTAHASKGLNLYI